MAIRFHCTQCRQLLGIARRKAGTEIQCPTCGTAQVVPTEEEALAALEASRGSEPKTADSSANGIVVYDDDPLEPAADESPSEPQSRPIPVPSVADEKTAPVVSSALRPVPHGMVLLRRQTLYVQAVVIAAVAAGGFAAGYFVGRGDARFEEQARREQAERVPSQVEGKLLYRPNAQTVAGDEGAVAIALPAGREPERVFSTFGIRPQDAPPRETDKALRAIVQFGGAYARADASGTYWLQVPDEGEYWILFISRHTNRPRGAEIEELAADQMKKYFYAPADLIGRANYRWTRQAVRRGMKPVDWHFGDGWEQRE